MTVKKYLLLLLIIITFFVVGSTKINYQNAPTSFKTPKGRQIKFKIIDKYFYVQWDDKNNALQTLDYKFEINGADAWTPRFISENDSYIFLRAGCGNPCWLGIFLPLYKDGRPEIIHEYLTYNLDKHYVAYINFGKDSLEVLNLKTSKKQTFPTDKCVSTFTNYCIDTMYFKDNFLYYKWNADTYINSKKSGQTKRVTIKI